MKTAQSRFLLLSAATSALAALVSFACGSTEGPLLVEHETADATPGIDGGDATSAPDASCSPTDDHSSNPLHCGRCNHSCGGGACWSGKCQPVLLATEATPFAITAYGDRVYWGHGDYNPDAGAVRSVRKDGSDPLYSPGQAATINGIHVDALGMVYTDGAKGNIWTATDYTQQPSLRYARGAAGAGEIVADETQIFWTDLYQQPGVSRASRTGTDAPTNLAPGITYYPFAIALKGDYVYWSNMGALAAGPDAGAPTGSIMRAKKDGTGAVETLASALPRPGYIAVDDTHVYAADNYGDAVWRVPLAGGTAEKFADIDTPNGVALDAEYVYVTDGSKGALYRVRKDKTGMRETLASNLAYPNKVVVDESFVYWVNQLGRTVMKVAKP